MISTLVLLLLLSSTSSQNILKFNNSTEHILCRHCGKEISTSDTIIYKPSATSLYAFNDTLFNRNDVLVQVLLKDLIFRFPVITSSHSTCIAKGEWEDDLWFSDYSWKPCYCECGALVGWVFQTEIATIRDPILFYGLILTNLIGENCNYQFFFSGLPLYRFTLDIPKECVVVMDSDGLSAEEKEFLVKCEEEFKDRFTEKDDEFMKVFNKVPSTPPIVENWWSSNNFGRRNDRRHNNSYHPYDRFGGNRDNRHRHGRGDYHRQERSNDNRGYNDYRSNDGYQRSRYSNY